MPVNKSLGRLSALAVLCLTLSSNAAYFGDGSARNGDSARDEFSGRGQSSRTEVSVEMERSSGSRRTEVAVSVSSSRNSGWDREYREERVVSRPVYDPYEERRRLEREMECARLERERAYYAEQRRRDYELACARAERERSYREVYYSRRVYCEPVRHCEPVYRHCEPVRYCEPVRRCEPAPRCGSRISIGGVIVFR